MERWMEPYRKKGNFVDEIAELLHKADKDIGLVYYLNTNTLKEHVEIHYGSGLIRRVTVTGEDRLGVLRCIAKHIK